MTHGDNIKISYRNIRQGEADIFCAGVKIGRVYQWLGRETYRQYGWYAELDNGGDTSEWPSPTRRSLLPEIRSVARERGIITLCICGGIAGVGAGSPVLCGMCDGLEERREAHKHNISVNHDPEYEY